MCRDFLFYATIIKSSGKFAIGCGACLISGQYLLYPLGGFIDEIEKLKIEKIIFPFAIGQPDYL